MYVAVPGYIIIIVNQTIQTYLDDNIFAEGKVVSSLAGPGLLTLQINYDPSCSHS